jgi:hypothetical protein
MAWPAVLLRRLGARLGFAETGSPHDHVLAK